MDILFFVFPLVLVAVGYVVPERISRRSAASPNAPPACCPLG